MLAIIDLLPSDLTFVPANLDGWWKVSACMLLGYTRPGDSGEQRISKKRPFFGAVVATESLCNVQSPEDKDTIRVEIDLKDSGLAYQPGDALGIHASNAPEVCTNSHSQLESAAAAACMRRKHLINTDGKSICYPPPFV